MKKLRLIALAMGMLGSAALAHAETRDINLGWMNLPECSRATCSGRGLFCPDTIEYAPQELSGFLHIEAPNTNQVLGAINHCTFDVALPTATLAAILANPASAEPTFRGAFATCMANQKAIWSSMYLYTATACKWR